MRVASAQPCPECISAPMQPGSAMSHVGVVEHEVRRLAAELKQIALHRVTRKPLDELADRG